MKKILTLLCAFCSCFVLAHTSEALEKVIEDLEEIPELSQPSKKEKSITVKKSVICKSHPLYQSLCFSSMQSTHVVSLEAHASHSPVLVIFWGSFCGPCLREFPSLERLAGLMPKLKIVSVAVDGKSDLNLTDLPLFYLNQGKEPRNQEFLEKHDIRGVPAFFLFDGQGKLLWKDAGAREWDSQENLQKLKSLLHTEKSEKRATKVSKVKYRKKSTKNKQKYR